MRPFALCSVLFLTACASETSPGPAVPFEPSARLEISLRNDSGRSIAYIPVGEGSLALILTPTTLPPGTYEDRLVAPGRTVPVHDILGYLEGLGVTFFVYLVDPASGEARFWGTFLASAAELAGGGGLVTFSDTRFRSRGRF